MVPNTFWALTLGEAFLMLEYQRNLDKAAWGRAAHQMSLLYNINRGKNRPLKAADFTPYEQELHHAPATVMTDDLRKDLDLFGHLMTHGTGQ